MAVQDAYRLIPWADVLYGCDSRWWHAQNGCPDFQGEKWSTYDKATSNNDKDKTAEQYGLNLVRGAQAHGFSLDPEVVHYGDNSGFQALNLAILMGARYIVLVGFDMRHVGGKSHFFGDHPPELFQRKEYESFARKFVPAPEGVTIVNATPGSALTAYPMVDLDAALDHRMTA